MPIYEFHCEACDYTYEYLSQVISDAKRACPKCGVDADMIFSAPRFHDFNRLMGTSDFHPYVTCNIRKDGKPVEIRSHKQLDKVCRENGVAPAFGKENRIG